MEDNSNPPAPPVVRPGRPRKPRNPDGTLVSSVEPAQAAPQPQAAQATDRLDIRRPMRDEDPREAAERRAAEIMAHVGGTMDE